MKQYTISKRRAALPELTGKVFNPETEPFCLAHNFAPIDSYVWEGDYKPEARAYVAWDEEGFQVLLCANEEVICTKATKFNDSVCEDSCLEFFLKPLAEDSHYMNFETNADGVALIGFCVDRSDMRYLDAKPDGMNYRASKHEGGWWAVSYTIPYALLEKMYGRRPQPGDVMRGNFYKCDESVHPHFGSWNPVVAEKPDFHRPECFAQIVFEA